MVPTRLAAAIRVDQINASWTPQLELFTRDAGVRTRSRCFGSDFVSANQIVAETLTTFEVDNEGMFATLHVKDGEGVPASLVLPAQCLNQLLMSIPKMIHTALKNRFQ